MDSFLELHNILLPQEKYSLLEKNTNILIFKYNQAIIKYTFELENIIIEPTNYLGYHVFRIINSRLNLGYNIFDKKFLIKITNFLELNSEIVIILNELLNSDYLGLCTCCSKPVNIMGLDFIRTCSDNNCIRTLNHLPTQDTVISSYQKDREVTLILIKFLIYCSMHHPKRDLAFNPVPSLLGVESPVDFVNVIPEYFKQNDLITIDKFISESENDLELYSKLDNISYGIIKNSLTSNYFNLMSRNDVYNDGSVTFISMIYPSEIEKDFHYKTNFLFHGASIFSWYPIIKNGLKVLSGTQLQANGAAYGPGIYMSDSLSVSLGYSSRSTLHGPVVGVFQLKEPIDKFKKVNNIFVIPDEKILLLRALIVFKSSNGHTSKILKEINDYYTVNPVKDIEITKQSTSNIKNKRLSKELDILKKNNFTDIKIIDESIQWEILLLNLKITINFSNYPLNAPNLVLTSGNLPSTIIDSASNIKIPILHPTNWTVKNNILEIIQQLTTIIQLNSNS